MKSLTIVFAVVLAAGSGLLAGATQAPAIKGTCTYISQSKANSIALAAVGGGTVLSAVLEKNDTPADWSVNVVAKTGKEYEVKVNACTGKVIAIIVGG